MDLLEAHPELGSVAEDLVPRGSFRHFPSPPYRVIYRLTEGEIWIARIWDTRRDRVELRVPEDARSAASADDMASVREGAEVLSFALSGAALHAKQSFPGQLFYLSPPNAGILSQAVFGPSAASPCSAR